MDNKNNYNNNNNNKFTQMSFIMKMNFCNYPYNIRF